MAHIEKVIIADDDTDDLLLFREAFEEACPHSELTMVMSGNELLHVLSNDPVPDAIFVDLHIPGKNGKECVKEIKENKELKNCTLIVLTGSTAQSDIDYCLENGADYFFEKPTSFRELKDIVEIVCKG